MDGSTDYACPICSMTFTRSGHLQRHYDTHSSRRAWKCDFCASNFKRSDALRKHWRTCSIRKLLGEPIPAQLSPGRRRRACDRCAADKQRCDQAIPCSNCATKSNICSYERASSTNNRGSDTFDIETWKFQLGSVELNSLPLALLNKQNKTQNQLDYGAVCETTSQDSQSRRVQIGFIIQLTKSSGLYRVFNYNNPDAHPERHAESDFFGELVDWQNPTWLDASVEFTSSLNSSSVIETSRMASWISHPLFPQSTAIWNVIQGYPLFASSEPSVSGAQCTQDHSYIDFFNPLNLERYLQLFWTRWSPHCLMIHRPSFDLEKTPIFMILIMALTGCLMSDSLEDTSNATKWLEVAEWTIFQQLRLRSAFNRSCGGDLGSDSQDTLRLLQSALLVCVVQHWEGLQDTKDRVRDELFPALVAASRDLGFDQANHSTDLDLDLKIIDWPRYVLNEELIRTYIYIFLFDNQYAIFHGTPPRMKLSELNMAFPCPEPCFKASTGDELLLVIQELGRLPLWEHKIRDIVQLLCSEHDHPTELPDMSGMSVLSLVTLVVAIQAVILCQSMSLCNSSSTISALRSSLNIWSAAWERRLITPTNLPNLDTSASSDDHLEESGWLRHAPEYHRVATLMIEKMRSNTGRPRDGMAKTGSSPVSQLEEVLELVM
ncbi:hypothetical protein FB567DRAFT_531338 [Paraphoma chrysanthemicola]|uniref:Uncharacterized protein n=1 Tax=Paraphoma chrysanthemicola TaxID=798071 RepID=A0A8K0VWX1_9PLEO|nr:hypothetical protein FB567DRAFT_531338 [Paraphoma chrysanthemicola]